MDSKENPMDHVVAVAMRGDDKYKRWPIAEMVAAQEEITQLRAELAEERELADRLANAAKGVAFHDRPHLLDDALTDHYARRNK